jgi:DNA-binding NtrC family response regulator
VGSTSVGEPTTRVSLARVVAATNRDLREEVRAGRFRSDLYHRLSVFELRVPALRELGDDKVRLLDYYRSLYATKTGTRAFAFDEAARIRWIGYPFPGNVRELKNIVIRLTTKYAGHTVGVGDLEAEFAPAADSGRNDPLAQARAELSSGRPFSLDAAVRGFEQAYLDAALEICQGNMSQAAKLLGISRTTLYGRLEAAGRPGAKLASSDTGDR